MTNESMKNELSAKNFEKLEVWNRGVDVEVFNPLHRKDLNLRKPVVLCVSRASREKGLDDFCRLEVEGTKVLVGDGPYLQELKDKYEGKVS